MMHNKTITELSAGLEAGEFSSVELTQTYLDRIKLLDKQLNSFITMTPELALEQAKNADAQRAAGNVGLLNGIPLAQKDIFCTKGVKTSCGSKMLEPFISPYDATTISQFNESGAVMLGKTNMDEFAMGSSNETSWYGTVKNPWNTDAVPGGSSGGSAAVVAARLAAASTGTDTGGSIRQPASFCGITGLKPTYGRVSRYGMIAFASSLDQAGPMTRTAEDAALMLNVMAGHDLRDSTSVDVAVPDYRADLNESVEGLKIGLPKEFFSEGLNDGVAKVIESAVKEYEKMGAIIKEISLPTSKLAVPTYYIIAPSECSSNLSRMDGVRFGHRCEDPKDLSDLYIRSRGEGFGPEVKRRILVGTYALSEGFYDAYYVKAQKTRRLISNDFNQAFDEVDVIMGPAAPSTAFNIGELTDDPITMYLSDIYTIAVNLAGLPGMSIPAGFSNDMPVGLQLIGKHFAEAKLLNVAHQFQKETDWHLKAPTAFK